MRSNTKEQASSPPKDIYQLFLDKEVRRAWGQEGTLKEKAEIILDYYQAMLQAIGVHQPCHQCTINSNVVKIQQNAQKLLNQLQERKQQIHQQHRPTRQDWRALFQACIHLSDEVASYCTFCEPIFLRNIIAQFHQVRKDQRQSETA